MQKNLKKVFGDLHGLDDKSVAFLTKALEKSNLPGFDYLEFKQSLAALAEMNMDESTAFRSAYATASTMGLTKEKLLESANHYKTVLSKEKQQFEAAMSKQMEQRVKSKEVEVEKLRKQIEEYQAKIKQLEEKIAKSQDTIDHADEHIQAAREKIETASENFNFTLQSIVNQIEKDIESIETHI